MDEILKQLEALDGGKDLVGKLRGKLTEQTGALDSLKAERRKATKALADAIKARDKAQSDLEGAKGSTDEQVAQHKRTAEEAVAKLEAAEKSHKAFRIQSKLAGKLAVDGKDEVEKAHKREAALKLGDWDGIDLDDKGNLVGADAPLKALQEAHSYLFAPPAKGNGGAAGGSGKSGRQAGPPPTDRDSKIAAWSEKLGYAKDDQKGAA